MKSTIDLLNEAYYYIIENSEDTKPQNVKEILVGISNAINIISTTEKINNTLSNILKDN
jgi:hypothetical protein